MNNSLGMRIKLKRKEKKLSQAKLAKLAEVTQSAISQLENGTSTNSIYLYNIAKSLGVTPEYLMDGNGEEENIRPATTLEEEEEEEEEPLDRIEKAITELANELRNEARLNHEILMREAHKLLRKVEKIEAILAKGLSDDR